VYISDNLSTGSVSMVFVDGGDSLEENFVLESEASESDDSVSFSIETSSPEKPTTKQGKAVLSKDEDGHVPAKKPKLNWRQGASLSSGSVQSQLETLSMAIVAFGAYFPKDECPISAEDISKLCFLDCSEYTQRSEKSTSELFGYLRKKGHLQNEPSTKKELKTLIVSGSATRAMYLVKELREFDVSLAPLPLFFHGGGRKKEQGTGHDTTLRAQKTSVAVCLPSRLKSASERGIVDYSNIDLLLIDLKANEKRLNVLSQKDTLREFMEWFADFVIPKAGNGIRIALV
jgi:hypothetical protein